MYGVFWSTRFKSIFGALHIILFCPFLPKGILLPVICWHLYIPFALSSFVQFFIYSAKFAFSVLTAIFPDKPWLDGYIGAKDDGSGGDNWRYWDLQKLQSSHHYQQINTQLFTGRMPFLSPNQQHQNWREIFSRVEEEFYFFLNM